MNCKDFQNILPFIIENGETGEEAAHLKECAVCSDLVSDLTYIANHAKLLLPMQEEPSPRVWENIQSKLERDGLLKPVPPEGFVAPQESPAPVILRRQPRRLTWAFALAAALLLSVGLFVVYQNKNAASPASTDASNTKPSGQNTDSSKTAVAVDDDDIQLLQAFAGHNAESRKNYEKHLHSVNQYIADAKQSVKNNPQDEQAQSQLMDAYDQKVFLYDVASRSAE